MMQKTKTEQREKTRNKERENEKMKTLIYKITAFVLAAVMAISLASCKEDMTGKMTVVIGGDDPTEYIVDLEKVEGDRGLVSVLDYLKKTKKIDYKLEGTMLTKVGDLENNSAESKYIYVYTTVSADEDVSSFGSSIEYKGMTIKSSGVGVYDMHMEEGAIIYIGIIRWL